MSRERGGIREFQAAAMADGKVLPLGQAVRSSRARGWRPFPTVPGAYTAPVVGRPALKPREAGALTEMPEGTEGSSLCARPRWLVLATWRAVLRRTRKLELRSEAERRAP